MTIASSSALVPERGSPLSSILLFALPALALTSKSGLGLVQILILLVFLRYLPAVVRAHLQHWGELRGVTLAFALYFLVSLLRMVLDHQPLRTLDGPARLLLGLSCIGVMFFLRPRIRYFWLGLCLTTMFAAVVASWQVFSGEMTRAVGFTHHEITFGDLALASGLMAACGLAVFRDPRLDKLQWLPVAALVSGLLASVLSGARGSWLALPLPLVLVPLLTYGRRLYGRRIYTILALVLATMVLACVIPATGVARHAVLVYSDLQGYFNGGVASTSVSIRLELWRAAWMMFAEHPWLGVGRDNFDAALHALAAAGHLEPSPALTYSSAQNDLLHCLATGGLLDASLLLLMYVAPLRYFTSELRRPDQGQHSLALAGLVLVTAFIGFGLTEAMFWLMMPKVFYVMMVCSLIGMCLAVRHGASTPRRILIARTDNIGDVVLTLPLAGYLKQLYPQAEITFLCRRYAAAVVAQCRHVDHVLTLEALGADLTRGLRDTGCDTVLFAFPRRELAYAARRAGINRRIGSTRRIYHWLTCNRLVNLTTPLAARLHEAQLSFKLLLALGVNHVPAREDIWPLYGLTTPRHPAADAVLAGPGRKIILHPKSNGNGREWPLEHYTALARLLAEQPDVRVLVTGSAAEGELLARQAPALLALPNVDNLCGKLELEAFTALIGGCDGLVASGTGPLHLAAALGRPVAGLFPPLKPIDPVRWAALGPRATNLVTEPGCGSCADPAQCRCMLAITPQQVLAVIDGWRAAGQSAA